MLNIFNKVGHLDMFSIYFFEKGKKLHLAVDDKILNALLTTFLQCLVVRHWQRESMKD